MPMPYILQVHSVPAKFAKPKTPCICAKNQTQRSQKQINPPMCAEIINHRLYFILFPFLLLLLGFYNKFPRYHWNTHSFPLNLSDSSRYCRFVHPDFTIVPPAADCPPFAPCSPSPTCSPSSPSSSPSAARANTSAEVTNTQFVYGGGTYVGPLDEDDDEVIDEVSDPGVGGGVDV
ncbi:hypothetical protein BZA77DRAFT_6035 [Pyronema omphalodes]|nr:hypothetical protein BZA77DRAFT_6035 [Pyronema omphalodes]